MSSMSSLKDKVKDKVAHLKEKMSHHGHSGPEHTATGHTSHTTGLTTEHAAPDTGAASHLAPKAPAYDAGLGTGTKTHIHSTGHQTGTPITGSTGLSPIGDSNVTKGTSAHSSYGTGGLQSSYGTGGLQSSYGTGGLPAPSSSNRTGTPITGSTGLSPIGDSNVTKGTTAPPSSGPTGLPAPSSSTRTGVPITGSTGLTERVDRNVTEPTAPNTGASRPREFGTEAPVGKTIDDFSSTHAKPLTGGKGDYSSALAPIAADTAPTGAPAASGGTLYQKVAAPVTAVAGAVTGAASTVASKAGEYLHGSSPTHAGTTYPGSTAGTTAGTGPTTTQKVTATVQEYATAAAGKAQEIGAVAYQKAAEVLHPAAQKAQAAAADTAAVAQDKGAHYSAIAQDKAAEYGTHAQNKASEYGTHAQNKAAEYGTHAQNKAVDYGNAAQSQTAAAAAAVGDQASTLWQKTKDTAAATTAAVTNLARQQMGYTEQAPGTKAHTPGNVEDTLQAHDAVGVTAPAAIRHQHDLAAHDAVAEARSHLQGLGLEGSTGTAPVLPKTMQHGGAKTTVITKTEL